MEPALRQQSLEVAFTIEKLEAVVTSKKGRVYLVHYADAAKPTASTAAASTSSSSSSSSSATGSAAAQPATPKPAAPSAAAKPTTPKPGSAAAMDVKGMPSASPRPGSSNSSSSSSEEQKPGGRYVGLVVWYPEGELPPSPSPSIPLPPAQAHLRSFYITPEFMGTGLSQWLMERVVNDIRAHVRAESARALSLFVQSGSALTSAVQPNHVHRRCDVHLFVFSDNLRAKQFYLKCGFKLTRADEPVVGRKRANGQDVLRDSMSLLVNVYDD
jgi:GNAT superfamily N-acetyltransferase